MTAKGPRTYALLLSGAALVALSTAAVPAYAVERAGGYNIAPQPLAAALAEFSAQSGESLLYTPDLTDRKTAHGVAGARDVPTALSRMLEGTGLTFKHSRGTYLILRAGAPERMVRVANANTEAAAADAEAASSAPPEANVVQELIVTAQKRAEAIQTVPIAISAFTQKTLEAQHIEGGFDLLKAIPNVTFSKNNFSGYNFSIRGIGTKAISVTTDPGVAVEFNDTPLIRNRLFEQEYFDVERVEVLRGPQGTLHGRNATSGVINVISAKPVLDTFEGSIKGEVGNYNTKRLVSWVNVPLVNDVLGVRLAGSLTQRDGYGVNLYDNSRVDGRNLWSGRVTVGFQPTSRFRADLVWERFHENDNRQRTGKQLCTHDSGLAKVGDVVVPAGLGGLAEAQSIFSQGCLPGSLYDNAAFGTPNGFAIPFISALASPNIGGIGQFVNGDVANAIIAGVDPYGNTTQSHDLRALYSQIKSIYRAGADVLELNMHFDLTPALTITSQTAYDSDQIYSTQDFNRYTTVPSFTDTSIVNAGSGPNGPPTRFKALAPGGIFCDPQLGCSNTIVGEDVSRAKSTQFSQEIRLQSNFSGPLNFSFGANYLHYKTVEDYYVFFNAATMAVVVALNSGILLGSSSPDRATIHPDCTVRGQTDIIIGAVICVPIEDNSIANIQDYGHNYFLSRNPYRLDSKSVFGETYWEITSTLKLTAGLRYTDDRKVFTPIPSQTALTPRDYPGLTENPFFGAIFTALPFTGTGFGYPVEPDVTLQWREVTGRIGLDWKPVLPFTDATMLYAFYSRGYKGGGMNPPPVGLNYDDAAAQGIIYTPSAPPNFRPEFVNAFEVGTKNTLLSGALVLNGDVFFYDYTDYQVSKIVDRTAQNENFDAKVWGLEIESVFAPTRNLRINASLGYLDTEIGGGSYSIDVMNRLAGHTDWVLVKPAMTLTSNCIMPVNVAAMIVADGPYADYLAGACPGGSLFGINYRGAAGGIFGITLPDGSTYDPADHPEANYGAGFSSNVSGKELPNSPHFTVTLGAEYSWDLFGGEWRATLRGDAYWQSQSWARVYELPIDKLHGWYNTNLSLRLENPSKDLKFEVYVKNVLNDTPITDTFTNSDDTALTTNIFTLDPRLIGVSVTKKF